MSRPKKRRRVQENSPVDAGDLEEILASGAKELGILLTEKQIKQFMDYLALLSKWGAVYSLTGILEPGNMVRRHLLDSLTVAPALKERKRLVDVGSGAGLPGIVLAVMYPEMQVYLIEATRKKSAFLSEVKAQLGLKNVRVITERVEKWRDASGFDAIISRAFSDLSRFVDVTTHLLGKGGAFYAMKGALPETEMDGLPAGLKVKEVIPLKVPFLDVRRHLLVMEKFGD